MWRHWMWDKTERWFSQAERLVSEFRFEEALRCFDEAIRTDPEYPHLHAYRALVLAELSRLEEALASSDRAEQIDPSNFVFPMYRAAILLDSGDAQAALQSAKRAFALEPGNPVIAGYQQLAKWDLGDETALLELRRILHEIPISVQSRVALRLEGKTPAGHTPDAPDSSGRPWSRDMFRGLRTARVKRRLERVRMMIAAQRYEEAMRRLEQTDTFGLGLQKELEDLYSKALEGECAKVRDRLKELEKAPDRKGRSNSDLDKAGAKQRRELLLKLGVGLGQIKQNDEAYKAFEKWLDAYRAAGSPPNENGSACSVLLEMAEIDLTRQTFERAVEHCHQARTLGAGDSDPRINLIEARAELARGHRLTARRLFEQYLSKEVFYLEHRIDSLIKA